MGDKDPTDKLVEQVRRRQARERGGGDDVPVSRRLAQIGVLGWIVVTPTLVGIFLGRWLDGVFSSGIFWTAPLLMIGLALGCWFAWRWVNTA